jgi:VanZ family protein
MNASLIWKAISWISLLAYLTLLTVATHLPPQFVEFGEVRVSDKTIHFFAYLVLGFVLSMALYLTFEDIWRASYVAIVVGIAWGGLDEWTQQFFRRHPDWIDFLYDVCGILIGVLAFAVVLSVGRYWTTRNKT